MIKAAIIIVFVTVASISAFAQSNPSPPAIKGDNPNSDKRPPVLNDSTGVKPRGAAAKTPAPAAKPEAGKGAEDEIFTVDTNLVTTPVSVLDRNGRFIPGLRKKDFKIFENGILQKITYFQSEERPFTVVLLIDTSPSTKYRIDEIHYAAVTFVNQLRPNDKVMIVAFDQRARVLCEPSSDRAQIYAAIYKSQFGSGTSLYDTVDAVVSLELVKIPGRKAVVLFTDGVDTTSRRADYQSTIAAVEEVDALFYPIRYNTLIRPGSAAQGPSPAGAADLAAAIAAGRLPRGVIYRSGRGQSEAEHERGRTYLETLAVNSGGRMFEADSITNLETSFAGVAEELRRQYSIGYYPEASGEPGERKKIKIETSRPRAVIRAKTSYVVKQDGPKEPPAASQPGMQGLF